MNRELSYRKSWSVLGKAVTMSIVLHACAIAPPAPVDQKRHPVVEESAKVRNLQQQIRERDKRIEELESQLEALKLIDQDSMRQKTPLRPPTMLEPLE